VELDRGTSVTGALKKLLGAQCQVCGWEGFLKHDGDNYIEAHHVAHLSGNTQGSLCTDNIILLCPNCHREAHHGERFLVEMDGNTIVITSSVGISSIKRNTIDYLEQLYHEKHVM
jgi:predicted HNH restriction endonuclease